MNSIEKFIDNLTSILDIITDSLEDEESSDDSSSYCSECSNDSCSNDSCSECSDCSNDSYCSNDSNDSFVRVPDSEPKYTLKYIHNRRGPNNTIIHDSKLSKTFKQLILKKIKIPKKNIIIEDTGYTIHVLIYNEKNIPNIPYSFKFPLNDTNIQCILYKDECELNELKNTPGFNFNA